MNLNFFTQTKKSKKSTDDEDFTKNTPMIAGTVLIVGVIGVLITYFYYNKEKKNEEVRKVIDNDEDMSNAQLSGLHAKRELNNWESGTDTMIKQPHD